MPRKVYGGDVGMPSEYAAHPYGGWRRLACARCNAPLGAATPAFEPATVTWCSDCAAADETALKARLEREACGEAARRRGPHARAADARAQYLANSRYDPPTMRLRLPYGPRDGNE